MKKEICSIILLILLFAGGLVNIHFLDKLTGEIAGLIEETETYVMSGDWTAARENAEKAREKWETSDSYTHMVLRHSEIEAAGSTLDELLKEVYSENQGSAQAAAKSAAARLRSVVSIEKIRLGSIF